MRGRQLSPGNLVEVFGQKEKNSHDTEALQLTKEGTKYGS